MFEDIHALVEFAEAGSIARAASRLHRTPSAITRQMQRLEAELGAQLLDRSVKPPRLTPLGIRIVQHSRDVLKHVDDLKALAATDAEPSGLFRIGVSHALADSALAFASNSRGRHAVSIETSISHIRPLQAEDGIIATAEEKSLGNRIAIYEVRIERTTGELVALFKGTVYRKQQDWELNSAL